MQGEYPAEAPFTISELEEIYPTASGKSKVDEDSVRSCPGCDGKTVRAVSQRLPCAVRQHILNVSIADLKKNYAKSERRV